MVHGGLSGALKYGVKMEILYRNAAQAVSPPRAEKQEVIPPDITRVKRVLKRAYEEGHPVYPALHLIAYTGLRRGECLGLQWGNVDLDAGTLAIVQTLGRSLTQGLIFQPPKTPSARRVVDLDEMTVDVLRAHRGRQLLERMQLGVGLDEHALVFSDPLGRPLNPMSLTRTFQSLAKKEGLGKARLHDLRHFHASVMFQVGQSPVAVSKRLGHSSVSTTMDIYSHMLGG